MKKFKIEKDANKLKRIAEPIDLINQKDKADNLRKLLLDCYYNYFNKKCQGLSAIQLGYNSSCILVQYDKTKTKEPIVLFNPKVIYNIGFRFSDEGCISVGQDRFIVKRPLLCYVEYQLIDGSTKREWLPYKKARIFCHEYDHTKGILITDKGVKIC